MFLFATLVASTREVPSPICLADMKRTIIFTFALIALTVLIGAFGVFQFVVKPKIIKSAITSAGAPPVTVSTDVAKTEARSLRLSGVGTFRAVQGIDIASETSGIVSEIAFESGQEVKKGDLLVRLDTGVEQADLKAAEAQLRQAQLELNRKKALLNRGNTSKASYDNALATRDSAAGVAGRIRAYIEQKTLTAPFDGRIGIRKVDIGQYVSAGMPIAALTQTNPIYIDFPLPEQSIELLKPGQEVQVSVDAIPDSDFHGVIQSIDSRVDAMTRNILVRAEFQNPDGVLTPGMYGRVSVVAGEPKDYVTVPRTAVMYSLYGDNIYIVKAGEDGDMKVAERRFVHTGPVENERVSILDGLKSGEEVATAGQLKLYEGAKVIVDNSAPLEAPSQRPKE